MSEFYLIAHKVRGEAAFDVATRMECPECLGEMNIDADKENSCAECDGNGFWWIIPTSGHRAYPAWYIDMNELIPRELIRHDDYDEDYESVGQALRNNRIPMPDSLPDHYPTSATPKLDIRALMPKKQIVINRR